MPGYWLPVKSAPVIFLWGKKNNVSTYYQNDSIITITIDNIVLIITKGGEDHEHQVQKI